MTHSQQLKRRLLISGGAMLLAAAGLYAGNRMLSPSVAEELNRLPKIETDGIASLKGAKTTKHPSKSKSRKIKIALLLDTSNSMDGLIDQAKSQLWTIVNELAAATCDSIKPEIEIALYEYGNDGLSSEKGYIRQVTPLTNDLDKLSEELFKLTTNGGDEYCGNVILSAVNQLEWSSTTEDLQVIFIAGNEPFSQGRINYKEACAMAKKKNIIVNTIFCGDFNEGISTSWKNGSDLTGGSYMSIEQNSKTVFIPSPYDDEIMQLNEKLNGTYLEYGNEGKVKKESQKLQDINAGTFSTANGVTRTISKTKHVYKNKSWDLVDASEDKAFNYTTFADSQLPDTMKTMTNEQKIKYVEQKRSEREKIKVQIDELNKKREAYLLEQRKKGGEDDKMLDKSMMHAIRKQAAEKNFTF